MSIQDRLRPSGGALGIPSVHPLKATEAAYAAVSALQTYPPEMQGAIKPTV